MVGWFFGVGEEPPVREKINGWPNRATPMVARLRIKVQLQAVAPLRLDRMAPVGTCVNAVFTHGSTPPIKVQLQAVAPLRLHRMAPVGTCVNAVFTVCSHIVLSGWMPPWTRALGFLWSLY